MSVAAPLILGFLLIYLAVLVGVFVLMGFGLWKMSKNAGIPHAWTSFIYPLYNMGLLAERSLYMYTGQKKSLAKWSLWLLIVGLCISLPGWFLAFFLNSTAAAGLVALLSAVSGIASMVLLYYCLYYVYKDYTPGNEVILLILSIFVAAYPIIFLVIMNVVPVSVAGRCPYGQPRYNRQPPQAPGGWNGPQG